jgi:hypothetical protein
LAAIAAVISFAPSSAFADYAPASGDVVGVGSDTLQAMVDFVADGDYKGTDAGYNSAGNKFKVVSIDATADANTRLAYGPGGANGFGTAPTNSDGTLVTSPVPTFGCAPGTDATIGTGNLNHSDSTVGKLPCSLNPTVVLRAGLSPEQRPNGSGAGFNLLNADTNTATGFGVGNSGRGLVNFSRASSSQTGAGNALFNSVTLGTDTIYMLSAGGTATSNAVVLTVSQLKNIYLCSAGATDWSNFGGTAGTIVPLLPQVGSGTRKTFLLGLNSSPSVQLVPGPCVKNVEENDPLAIQDSSDPVNAIEPMSQSRLLLFQGLDALGGSTLNGYFKDPSCPFNPTTSSQANVNTTSNAPAACQGTAATIVPQVKLWTTGFNVPRDLLVYFRVADINEPGAGSAAHFQPGGTLDWVRTLFYNPCPVAIGDPAFGTDGCSTSADGLTGFGPGGAPYFASFAGQTDISRAGVTPKYAWNGTTE